MLTKKQYITMLVCASIVLLAIFTFTYIYTVTHMQSIIPEEEPGYEQQLRKDREEIVAEVSNLGQERILPSTEITMRILDQYNKVISEESVEPSSLLGLSQVEIEKVFDKCKVTQFDTRQVIIEKNEYIEPKPLEYTLGIEQGEIGIITEGEKPVFSSLGLSTKEFSKHTNLLFMNEMISISPAQKQKLEKDPNYIEYILQNLSE